VSHRAPAFIDERRGVRAFGMDVHRDFCEVAIAEGASPFVASRRATLLNQLVELAVGSPEMHIALKVVLRGLVDFDTRRPELSHGHVDPLHQQAD